MARLWRRWRCPLARLFAARGTGRGKACSPFSAGAFSSLPRHKIRVRTERAVVSSRTRHVRQKVVCCPPPRWWLGWLLLISDEADADGHGLLVTKKAIHHTRDFLSLASNTS